MASKDLFSDQARLYAAFRPTYPDALYDFIFQHLQARDNAWDCATGNGQVARRLAEVFKKVYASDISNNQLQQAHQASNIIYSNQKAEHTNYPDRTFDLVSVGQALHWFNLDLFYKEVKRVTRPGGVVALWGYGNIIIRPDIDSIIHGFYYNVVGEYWEPARRIVEDHYQNIPFPFKEIQTPDFTIEKEWTLNHLIGYIESWSSTQTYVKKRNVNPVNALAAELEKICNKNDMLQVEFPVFLKLGKIS